MVFSGQSSLTPLRILNGSKRFNKEVLGMVDTDQEDSRTVTKSDIVEKVYEKVGFSKKESSELVELIFETIKGTLEKGEKIKITGFGKFEVRDKKPRRGRNPQTGGEIEISARRVLLFKASQVLKNILAGLPPDAPAGAEVSASASPPPVDLGSGPSGEGGS
jgi:integration host factor subunit alpha